MCEKCDRYPKFNREQVWFNCGFCGKKLMTEWVPKYWGGGLLHGDYVLLGDVVFHDRHPGDCADFFLKPLTDKLDYDAHHGSAGSDPFKDWQPK